MTGDDVEVVHRKLGLPPNTPYNTTTARMVQQLARKAKVATDGEVTKDVAAVLGESADREARGGLPSWYTRPILQMFQEGEDVRALRERLGLGSNDNRYDADAEAAVRRVQSANGLYVNGVVDEATARAL